MIESKYKYEVVYSTKFKKSLKKIMKQEKDIEELLDVIDKLSIKEELEAKYRDHNLINDKKHKNCRECHIRPDWLLIYKYQEDELILLLVNTGSHSEVLNK